MTVARDLISAARLARLIGVSESAVNALVRRGVLARVAPATFDRDESVQNYCAHLRLAASGVGQNPDGKAASLKSGALLRDAQRELTEVRIAAERRELLPKDFVFGIVEKIIWAFKGKFLELPDAVAARLSLSPADYKTLEAMIDDRLNAIAESDVVVKTLDELGLSHSLTPMTRERMEAAQ
jgi:hypothetical protein